VGNDADGSPIVAAFGHADELQSVAPQECRAPANIARQQSSHRTGVQESIAQQSSAWARGRHKVTVAAGSREWILLRAPMSDGRRIEGHGQRAGSTIV